MRKYILTAIAALTLITGPAALAVSQTKATIERIAPYVFPANKPKTPGTMVYMPDGLSYLQIIDDGKVVARFETASGKKIEDVLLTAKTRTASIDRVEGVEVSADGNKLLVYTGSQPVYRHSFKARFFVFEIKRNILEPVSENFPLQQIASISPDGRMVAFVADGNIYIRKLDYHSEVPVTTDGAKNKIINGLPDWTYEEEFALTSTLTWAPDNSALSYVKFDESEVPLYSFPLYQGVCNPQNQYALYPGSYQYKYPVAGQKNSKVGVYTYDVANRTTKRLEIPEPYEYIPRISYAYSPDRLMVVTLNRAQNEMQVYAANPKSTVARNVLTEKSSAWLLPSTYENIKWLENGFVVPSDRSGYNHLYLYSYAGSLMRQVTSGDWNVSAYYGADPAGNHYFQATIGGPINRTLCRIDPKGKITELSPREGYASADFAPDCSFYTLCFSNADSPAVYTLKSTKGATSRVLIDNADLRSKTHSSREFFTFNSDGVELNGYIVKPADFSDAKRYPVIMWLYNGPDSQEVLNRWQLDWQQAAADMGYVVVCVDGRGTGGRDRKFATIVYRNLGHYETIDQVNAARYIAAKPWADPKRIGICGWSYGGYETLMAASAPNAPYAAAVAIAPVTDWRYYDTVYAERYMLTPAENEDGYRASAPINITKQLECPLLIMHGTADDNVHLSNSIEYVARLIADNNAADLMLFPNMNHSIRDCNGRAVVYGKMIDFFNKNLR